MDIEHIALNVADPVVLADWYVRHLGMRVVRQVDTGPRTRFLADGAGRTVLEVYRQEAPVPDYFAMDPMVLHIAFKVADVAAECHRLVEAGATIAKPAVTSDNGDAMAFHRDPWGVTIQLVKRGIPLAG
jgi:glyoxylase I family protein